MRLGCRRYDVPDNNCAPTLGTVAILRRYTATTARTCTRQSGSTLAAKLAAFRDVVGTVRAPHGAAPSHSFRQPNTARPKEGGGPTTTPTVHRPAVLRQISRAASNALG